MKNLYRINLNLLIALDTLLKEKSVTRAAKKLFITQAAMSNNLKQLRHLFNNELLLRNNNQFELTPLAEKLAPQLNDALKTMENLIQFGQEFNPLSCEKNFKVGMVDVMANLLLPELMPILNKEAPNTQLNVIPLLQVYDSTPFENDNFDIVIARASDSYPLPKSIHREILFKDHNVCILNSKHPLAKKKEISLADYANHKHVAWRPDNPHFVSVINEFLKSKNFQERVSTLHLSYTDTLFQVIESSDHLIGTIINTAAQFYQKKYQFVIKKVPLEPVTIDFYIIWHKRFDEDKAHLWLRTKIIDIFKNKSKNN